MFSSDVLFPLGIALATIGIYIIAATDTSGWLARGYIAGILALYLLTFGLQVWRAEKTEEARSSRKKREDQLPVASSIRQSRWLPGFSQDDSKATMLDQLGEIPSARFASMRTGPFKFLAVADTKVVLVATLDWPPGTYTLRGSVIQDIRRDGQLFLSAENELSRVVAEAKSWQARLEAAEILIVVVVQSTDPSRTLVLQLHDDEVGVEFTTPDKFGDTAGSFLLSGGYDFDVPFLVKLIAFLRAKQFGPYIA